MAQILRTILRVLGALGQAGQTHVSPIFQTGRINRVVKQLDHTTTTATQRNVGQTSLPTPVQGPPCSGESLLDCSKTTRTPLLCPPHRQVSTGPSRGKVTSPRGKGPQLSPRGTSLHSLQFKIGHQDACQDLVMLLANRRVTQGGAK